MMMDSAGCGVFTVGPQSPSVHVEPLAYSIENPAYPLDDPGVWVDAGMVSQSGSRVTPASSLRVPAVYQALTRISGDVARCPLELLVKQGDTWVASDDDDLYELVAIAPNREMNAFKFWVRVMVYRLLWQNAYVYIARDVNDKPRELLPLLPDRTEPERRDGVLRYWTEVDGQKVPIPAKNVLHFEGIGFDNLQAESLVAAARDAWGLALAELGFASKFFKRGGRLGGVLEIPASFSKKAAAGLEEGFRKKYDTADAAFLTVILRENAKFHAAQATMRDSQMTEARRESTRDVARMFNIRPGHLGEESAVSYGSKYEDTRDYIDMTLAPHFAGIAAECRFKLIEREEWRSRKFRHNTDDILRLDPKELLEALGTGVEKEILSRDEARGSYGLQPKGDDELRNPNTTSHRGDSVSAVNRAHEALLNRTLGEVVGVIGQKAGRASASGKKFVAWLDGKLPGEREALARVIAPIAECMAAVDSRCEANTLATRLTDTCYESLQRGLSDIADRVAEKELREEVARFFDTFQPLGADHGQT